MMAQPLYQLRNVQHCYSARTVLDIPAMDIQPGEALAIVGPSGAGKSTLLRLLALLEPPTTGAVRLNLGGQPADVATATLDQRRALAMVFQRPALLSRTVRDNIAYGLRIRGDSNGRRRIDAALDRVSLTALADAHARTLSGGEVQRVALARALVLEPRVLLLDEPTANLDPANVRIIEALVREQHQQTGATVVMVTHNIFQARRLATRVALLIGGELVEAAPVDEFFNAPRDPRTSAFVSGDLVY
jgi:tungstate transport system ATP-binding protein